MGKSMTGEDEKKKQSFTGEEKKAACNTWTAGAGRVHPCASSMAAAAQRVVTGEAGGQGTSFHT
ncbi:hypothetical protein CFC21_064292 [Triticum aestivum]|uniref:Uncharacterized protein n=4 Tax=Triticum TaxID=4564 RepID=A0A9R0WJS0_TRITD|nr:hypothetical protein TRIUR3_07017 [Triticum urartu]KAF7056925.1 hypothetical protein CFC21_064292 [Triticum aestivum]VAI13214.1 unnamed protein product [Triticum turgidum subsp. durum]